MEGRREDRGEDRGEDRAEDRGEDKIEERGGEKGKRREVRMGVARRGEESRGEARREERREQESRDYATEREVRSGTHGAWDDGFGIALDVLAEKAGLADSRSVACKPQSQQQRQHFRKQPRAVGCTNLALRSREDAWRKMPTTVVSGSNPPETTSP